MSNKEKAIRIVRRGLRIAASVIAVGYLTYGVFVVAEDWPAWGATWVGVSFLPVTRSSEAGSSETHLKF